MPLARTTTRLPRPAIAASLALLALFLCNRPAGGQTPLPVGGQAAGFELSDVEGVSWSVAADASAEPLVVVFMGHQCPMVRQYVPRLNELQKQFADHGIRWLAINSNQQDSLAELQAFVRRSGLVIPLLKDPGNRVADQFGATRTPEVFLLDGDLRVQYHGRIDDQFAPGIQRPRAVQHYLEDALEALVTGEPVSRSTTKPAGCIIGRLLKPDGNEPATVTWHNQISRIVQKNCQSCHRAGEIGPFALGSWEEAAGWAGMIQEVVNQGRMPPWHASPEHGVFSNDSRLTSDEIEMINTWVDSGAPQGNPSDAPDPVEWTVGWQIGEPDVVLPMDDRPWRVPATGTVEYQYFQVDPGFTEDKWVTAAECRPGNRAVIHHIIVGIRGAGDFGRRSHRGLQSDWIAAAAPGSPAMTLPPGYAKKIPAGSKLVFQIHYTPDGTATTDLSSIGLKFLDPEAVTHQVMTLKAFNRKFVIPPNKDNKRVTARFRFERESELLSLFPHMHVRGKSFRYTAEFPDGSKEILLDVPRYDFNWQNAYELTQPRLIPAGTWFACVAHFDNSANNLANPDPEETVRWGDQTWEEMMIGYFNVAVEK